MMCGECLHGVMTVVRSVSLLWFEPLLYKFCHSFAKCSPVEFITMTRALMKVWDGVSSLYDMAQRDLKAGLVDSALKEASAT